MIVVVVLVVVAGIAGFLQWRGGIIGDAPPWAEEPTVKP